MSRPLSSERDDRERDERSATEAPCRLIVGLVVMVALAAAVPSLVSPAALDSPQSFIDSTVMALIDVAASVLLEYSTSVSLLPATAPEWMTKKKER